MARTAVLDALQQDSGDILQASVEYQDFGSGVESARSTWVYPAFPAVGQQVRFREVDYRKGKPSQDVESIYTEDEALEHTSMSTTQGPGSAMIVGVDYPKPHLGHVHHQRAPGRPHRQSGADPLRDRLREFHRGRHRQTERP